MTIQQIEAKFIELKHRKPFIPFVVEMIDGSTIVVPHSCLSIDCTGAGFIDDDAGLVDVPFDKVRSIRVDSVVELSYDVDRPLGEPLMKMKDVETKVIELIYRQPFTPFVVEFDNGESLEVPNPDLAITSTGAGFIDNDGALVDFEFGNVRSIRVASTAEHS